MPQDCPKDAQVAQLVEQRTENPRVGGSNPPLGTILFFIFGGHEKLRGRVIVAIMADIADLQAFHANSSPRILTKMLVRQYATTKTIIDCGLCL